MPLFQPFPGTLTRFARNGDWHEEQSHTFRSRAESALRPLSNKSADALIAVEAPFYLPFRRRLMPTATDRREHIRPFVPRTNPCGRQNERP